MSRADEPTETENRGPTSAGFPTRRAEAAAGPDPDRAAGGVEVATHLGPEDAQAALGRGRAWQARGTTPGHSPSSKGGPAQARRRLCPRLPGRRPSPPGRLRRGGRRLRPGDRRRPGAAWLYNGRGTALHADDDDRAAVADYDRAIALDPDFADPYRNRGLARAAEGDFEAAIADYTEAIRLSPVDASSYFLRGEARSQAEDFEAAVADSRRGHPPRPEACEGVPGPCRRLGGAGPGGPGGCRSRRGRAARRREPTGGAAMSVTERKPQIHTLIQSHFDPTPVEDLTITERQFPLRVRADLQRAVDRVFPGEVAVSFFCGVRKTHAFEGISFSELLVRDRHNPAQSVPPLYEEIDVGEEQPVRCLKNGLWLLEAGRDEVRRLPGAEHPFHQVRGCRSRWPRPTTRRASGSSQDFLKQLEEAVQRAESYRGKVLSLEAGSATPGSRRASTVHRLRTVERDQVILPARTLDLLERNVVRFVGLAVPAGRARAGDEEGAAVLRPAGHGQDAHDPLPGRCPAGPHDAPDHRRAGRPAGRVHDPGPAAPAEHRGDRGRGPDRPGPHRRWAARARRCC